MQSLVDLSFFAVFYGRMADHSFSCIPGKKELEGDIYVRVFICSWPASR
jgi:hypothetical protein